MRRVLRAFLPLAIASFALAGCAKREQAVNPSNPTWLSRPGWALGLTFRTPLAAEQGLTAKASIEKSTPGIDPLHARVFVGTSDHGLYAVRAGDGSVIWRFQTGGAVMSEPLYDAQFDVVYFGSDDGGLYAVRASDGGLLFRYATGAEVQRRPVLVRRPDGRAILVFDNAADGIFAVDAKTGETRWKHLRTPALGLEIAGHAGVAYDADRIYAAFSTGRVVAYDVDTGRERWPEVDLTSVGGVSEGEEQRYFDVDTTPLVYGDRVFVANVTTGIFALDSTAGTQIWRRPEAEGVSWLASYDEPAHVDLESGADVPARNLVIAGSGTTGLWAIDPKTGDVRWRRPAPRGTLAHPVQIAGALLVTSSKLGLFLFDVQSGLPIDGIDPGTGFTAGARAYGNRAFVLTNAGTLLGLEVVPPRKITSTKSW
jgi:outer membrane protein assembly factor BamB